MVVRGVQRGAFVEQQLCSRDIAVGRRQVQRRGASGGFFSGNPSGRCGLPADDGAEAEAPWEDDGSGGNAELYTRSTEKRTMNALDFKQNTFIYKHSRHLFSKITFC